MAPGGLCFVEGAAWDRYAVLEAFRMSQFEGRARLVHASLIITCCVSSESKSPPVPSSPMFSYQGHLGAAGSELAGDTQQRSENPRHSSSRSCRD